MNHYLRMSKTYSGSSWISSDRLSWIMVVFRRKLKKGYRGAVKSMSYQ
jgi:hypothetical protein